jgi:hypothetical protein
MDVFEFVLSPINTLLGDMKLMLNGSGLTDSISLIGRILLELARR